MPQAPSIALPHDLIDDRTVSRLQALATVAREDAVGQRHLLLTELKPPDDVPEERPSVWLYRAVRLLPLREVLGRRLGAALEYQAGRRLADQAPISSLRDLMHIAQELGFAPPTIVSETEDSIVVDEFGCLTCKGLPNIGEMLCHFEAGMLSRGLEKALGRSARTAEVQCFANGDDRCRFFTALGPGGSALASRAAHAPEGDQDPIEALAALAGAASEAMRLADELYQKNQILSLWATTDALTGLANRRQLMARMEDEIQRSIRYGVPLALAIIDLDDFKQVNDQFGHQVGDIVLKRTAHAIRADMRSLDLVARYGGEEFAVLLPHIALEDAARVMRRVGEAVAAHDASPGVSVSIGVAATPPAPADLDTLLSLADNALYQAKCAGKNCVVVAEGAEGGQRIADS